MSATGIAQPTAQQAAPGAQQQPAQMFSLKQAQAGMTPQQIASYRSALNKPINPGNTFAMMPLNPNQQNPLGSLRSALNANAGGAQTGTAAQGGNAGATQGGGAAGGGKSTADPLQPSYINANQFGPKQSIQDILAGFEPQARMAQSDLNSQLAAAGIVGGGATGATQALQGQLTSSLAPTLASAIQNSQGMQLTADQANQQAANAARSQLGSYLMQAWQVPYEAQAGLASSALGGYGGLAGQEAQNFAVPPQSNLFNLFGLLG